MVPFIMRLVINGTIPRIPSFSHIMLELATRGLGLAY